jgi:hypothetical protein
MVDHNVFVILDTKEFFAIKGSNENNFRFVYNGKILNNIVICDPGWSGLLCNEKICKDDCNF